jgi:uroporphyrinogen-III synthase
MSAPVHPSAPLAGLRVVVTRAADGAAALARRLSDAGAVPVLCPVIEIGPAPDPAAFDAALRHARTADWLVFTSAVGVQAALARAAALGLDPTAWPRVAAIGPATADALRAAGLPVAFVPPRFVGEALAEGLPGVAGRRVLLLRAEDGRAVLRTRLEARGARVHDVAAYSTGPAVLTDAVRADLATGVDAVTFTAASTVRHFLALLGPAARPMLEGATVATIGPATTAAARLLGLRVDTEASAATLDGLVEALAGHLAALSS